MLRAAFCAVVMTAVSIAEASAIDWLKDTGKTIEKSVKDVGHAAEKAVQDAGKAIGKGTQDVEQSPSDPCRNNPDLPQCDALKESNVSR
jgi:hypothetical protein